MANSPGAGDNYNQTVDSAVTNQPVTIVTVSNNKTSKKKLAYASMTHSFSLITLAIMFGLGCWWVLPCAIAGYIFGFMAIQNVQKENEVKARLYTKISAGFTIASIAISVVGFILVLIYIIVITSV